ncbi:MAG: hypothetical protein RQ885_13985 [Desulfurococcales archaeon]|nr:hypothetical protein [Desulfurococcales archaeon]
MIHKVLIPVSIGSFPHSTSRAICPGRLLGRAVKPGGKGFPSRAMLGTPKPFWAGPHTGPWSWEP